MIVYYLQTLFRKIIISTFFPLMRDLLAETSSPAFEKTNSNIHHHSQFNCLSATPSHILTSLTPSVTHTHIHTQTHTHTYRYTHIHIHTHTHTYRYTHTHIHTHTYIHTHTHTYTHTHTHTHWCVPTCSVCVCVWVA